ncbi:hypothetical protein MMYC01_205173 [Madurella mycetomatis]|uniref:Uncharacterized protein n=1 Tax=Madurella mycetomatis TaxID=100816 RepID=A0A175WBW8_9PEZI|nr:hypothetical protein MMYC01_205173 [Madurella mycetomatis]
MSTTTKWLLAAGAILSGTLLATAQSSFDDCPRPIQDIADDNTSFNSTGSASFSLGLEGDAEGGGGEQQGGSWYLSYSLTDRRGDNINFGSWVTAQELNVYLSVPESLIGTRQGNDTRFCMYMMPGQNETSRDGSGSCSGVLSDECLRALRNTPPPTEERCPQADIEEQCGWRISVGRVGSVPHVDLPTDYLTYGGFTDTYLLPPDPDRDSFEVYDLRVRQPIPMLITARYMSHPE